MRGTTHRRTAIAMWLLLHAAPAAAGSADVLEARAQCEGTRCRFDVTVQHEDEGPDHYADRYQVLDPDGSVLGTRVLRHPHVEEQPFTRGLVIEVPEGVLRVKIVARDSLHGEGGRELALDLER